MTHIMERKQFLTAVSAAAGAALASFGIAKASATYVTANPPGTVTGASPSPTLRPPHGPGGHRGLNELEAAEKRLERIIARLQEDQNPDNSGYRARAIADMEQAKSELLAAIQYEQAHPSTTTGGTTGGSTTAQ